MCVSHDKSRRSAAAVHKTSDILYELFLSPCWAVMWKLVQFEEEISGGKKARQRQNWLNDQRAGASDNYEEVFAGFAKRGEIQFYSFFGDSELPCKG